MEIKSTLLNSKDFEHVKNSLIEISQKDGKEKFRVKMVEYIDDTSYNDDDMFFYDMMEAIRFLDPSEKAVAYTTPEHLIYMNSPGNIGENIRYWDFIYDHECLHQLWDTFGVAEKLKKDKIEFNHYVLNIASDCVINDYLYYFRKKDHPDGLITPEYLKEQFGVEYDRKVDTQYTLYLKLIEKKEELEKDQRCQEECGDKIKPKSVKQSNQPTPPSMPQGKHSEDYKKGWSDAIKDVLDKKADPTDENYKPKSTGNDEYDEGYNDCMDKIKEGLENGIEVSDNKQQSQSDSGSDLQDIPWDIPQKQQSPGKGQGQGEDADNDPADKAQDAADKAKDAADKAQKSADNASSKSGDSQGSDSEGNDSQSDNASDSSSQSNSSSQSSSSSSKSNIDPDKAQDAASRAKDAAARAQAAADKAKEAAENGDTDAAQEAANEAADAAKEAAEAAKEAAGAAGEGSDSDTNKAADAANDAADSAKKSPSEMAKNAANKAKQSAEAASSSASESGSKDAKDAAKEAADAAKEAAEAAKKAEKAEQAGDMKGAEKAAKEAQEAADKAARAAQEAGVQNDPSGNSTSNNEESSEGQGHGGGEPGTETYSEANLEELKKKFEKTIEKYKNTITGALGEFISRCKSSLEMNKSGLEQKVKKGTNGWNKQMDKVINQYIRKKVFQMNRQKKKVWNRPHRREDYIKNGQPIMAGKKVKDETMIMKLSFYVDRSGSMGSALNTALDACYTMCEGIARKYKREKTISETAFDIFAFDDYIHPIKFGKKISLGGGTMDMDQLCKEIEKHSNTSAVNIVITDGYFNINEQQVTDLINNKLHGIVVFIINRDFDEMKSLADKIDNLYYIRADENFEIDV